MVQGYHIYKGTWDALIGEELLILSREGENYVNHLGGLGVYYLCTNSLAAVKLKDDKILAVFLLCTCAC